MGGWPLFLIRPMSKVIRIRERGEPGRKQLPNQAAGSVIFRRVELQVEAGRTGNGFCSCGNHAGQAGPVLSWRTTWLLPSLRRLTPVRTVVDIVTGVRAFLLLAPRYRFSPIGRHVLDLTGHPVFSTKEKPEAYSEGARSNTSHSWHLDHTVPLGFGSRRIDQTLIVQSTRLYAR